MRLLLLMLGLCLGLPSAAEEEALPRWLTLDQPQALPGTVGTPPESLVELLTSAGGPSDVEALQVGIAILDPGTGGDSAGNRREGIFPEVRDAESRYLPYAIRRTLVDSNQWGPVRVLPGTDPGFELLITGEILVSDGETLSLQLRARDSRDRTWIDKTYTRSVADSVYLEHNRRQRRPFQDLYNEIANDLLAYRQGLEARELAKIRDVSTLRHAASLLPDAFSDFLARDASGEWRLQRLPARDDPMLLRLERVREQEYLFIDTTDEQYADLYTRMTPIYDLWRQYLREQLAYRTSWEERLEEREKPRSGSFEALKYSYNNFKWEKIQRQEMKVLAEGFNNEIEPTSINLEGTIVNLNGSLDERYREWRRILHQIYVLETGA
jgi:hypothetical protein